MTSKPIALKVVRPSGVTVPCPICQGTEFGPAPNDRLSQRGLPPRCLSCKSLERHRAGRALMELVRDRERFKEFSLLQFGEEGVVAKGWFKTVETYGLGKPGAMDPAKIPRPDGSIDCVVSAHIITKLPDHRAAIRELGRVLSARGIAYLSFPSPTTRQTTSDWGKPDPKQNGEYRILGKDFETELAEFVSGIHVTAVRAVDPVTGDESLVYLLMKDFFWMRQVVAKKIDARFLESLED